MEEKFEDPELDKKANERINKEINTSLEEAQLKKMWRKEIESNMAIQNYFEAYIPSSIGGFVDSYLHQKYQAYKYKTFCSEQLEKLRTKWIDEANEHLEPILQKKLFDLQCLWRAEEIKLEGVDIVFDFTVWQNDIFNCPFIEINQYDIDLYQEFLTSGQADRYCSSFYEWQDYDSFKNEDEGMDMPEWYDFHNLRTGNNRLLMLGDVRGKKEDFYITVFHNDKRAKEKPITYDHDPRPYLHSYHDETLHFFVDTFEDAETKKNIQNYKEYFKFNSDDRNLDEVLMYMDEVEENIPIESHYDYREALVKAYDKYFTGKVAEHLPLAFEQYLFTKNMKLERLKDDDHKFYLDLKSSYYNKILKGRELNGEPRDLNF